MSKSMQLHPTKGLNAHMTCCTRCGKDGDEIVLLGNQDSKYICGNCGLVHYGHTAHCQKCGNASRAVLKKEAIGEWEKLPSTCKECREENEKFWKVANEAAKTGGIIYKCQKCGSEGVITGTADIAVAVRKKTEVLPPKLVGVELAECPRCEEEETDEHKGRARADRARKTAQGRRGNSGA